MDANSLVAEFGSLIGLSSLSLNDQGQCRLTVDGTTVVDLEHDESAGVLHVYSSLGGLPVSGREAVMETLLTGNLFGAETAGGALAYDPAEGDVVLCRAVPTEDLAASELVTVVEQHVAAAEEWQKRLSGAASGERQTPSPDGQIGQGIRA